MGLIAQEVEKVIPELVRTDKEGYKAVSYEKLTAVLVEAVKEQQKQNDQLKARVGALEAKLERAMAQKGGSTGTWNGTLLFGLLGILALGAVVMARSCRPNRP